MTGHNHIIIGFVFSASISRSTSLLASKRDSVFSFMVCWVGPLSPRLGASSDCGRREVLRLRRVAANIFNKQSRTADKGWSSRLAGGRGTNNPSP
jgi:hypothetical protein